MIESLADRPFFYDVALYFDIEEGPPQVHGSTLICRTKDDLIHELYHIILGHRYICGRGVNETGDSAIASLRRGSDTSPVENMLSKNRDLPLQMGTSDTELEEHLRWAAKKHLRRGSEQDLRLALSCIDRPLELDEGRQFLSAPDEVRASFFRVSPQRRHRRLSHLSEANMQIPYTTLIHVCKPVRIGKTYYGSSPFRPITGTYFHAGILLEETIQGSCGKAEEAIRCIIRSSHLVAYRAANCTVKNARVVKEVGFNL